MTFTTAICLEDIGGNILGDPITIYSDKDFYITPITTTTLNQITLPNCPLIVNNIPIGATKIKLVSENNLCVFIDIEEPPFFEAVFDTAKNGLTSTNQLKLPFISGGTYDVYIDWGDGGPWNNVKTWNDANLTHTYSNMGVYNVKIYAFPGFFKGFNFYKSTNDNSILGDRLKILEVLRWGPINLGNDGFYFSGCANLNLTNVIDVLNLDNTTNFRSMFHSCANLTCINKVNEWDTSNVTLMYDTFNSAINYNCDLSGWTTSKVTNMQGMFQNTHKFNKNIGNWNLSNVTNTSYMFQGALSYDNNGSDSINNWNTSKVTSMAYMFQNAIVFNRNVGNWNVSVNKDFNYMFGDAKLYNNNSSPSIGNWITSAATSMGHMFYNSSFNQPIGSWDVRKVTTDGPAFFTSAGFTRTFSNSPFNQNIGSWVMSGAQTIQLMFSGNKQFNNGGSDSIKNWDTRNVIDFRGVFTNAENFNQPLNWNTSKGLYFGGLRPGQSVNQSSPGMFEGAKVFNQPIGSWVMTAATNLRGMFANATAFDQDIGAWNPINATNYERFMTGKTNSNYSTINYNNLLNSWSTKPLQTSRVVNFGLIKYTSIGKPGRDILTGSSYNWTIIDGGQI